MPQAPPGTILRYIERAARTRLTGTLTDTQLLRRFAVDREETAFAALMQRHGRLVWSVCRHILRREHDAEDAFQATFLVLARRAAFIRNSESVGSWLHGVAYRIAVRVRQAAARRELHERQAATPEGQAQSELALWELQAVLDEEVQRLPRKYRAPFVLCCLEGRSRKEAAGELGWKAGTVSSRIAQARRRLQQRLARRGVALSAALCAVAVGEGTASAAVPAGLAGATARAAVLIATGQAGGAVAAHVLALTEGVVQAMVFSRGKVAAVLVLVLALAGVGVALVRGGTPAAEPPAKEAPQAGAEERVKPATPEALRVVVLDSQGKPLAGANVHSSIWTKEKGFKANHDYETDDTGAARVELPKTFYVFRLWAGKKPFVTLYAGWEQNELASGKDFPAEYTIRLEEGVNAGGRIVDEQGQPIAGATIQVKLASDPKPAYGDGRMRYDSGLATGTDAATTGADGRWRIDNVPNHPQVELSLLVTHPDYVSDEQWQQAQKAAGVTAAMLRQGTVTLTLKRGVVVSGRVTDPDGQPIKDAVVVLGDNPYMSRTPAKFPTDADGRFRLPALSPRQTTLTVLAPGWAPELRQVNLQAGVAPQDFHMGPGKPIRLRVVDAAGKPVPRAYVNIMEWKRSKSIQTDHNPNHPKVPDTKIPRRTDADGVWDWPSAPEDPVRLHVYLQGFAETEVEIAGGAAERTVTLKAEHRVTGRVTDAVTGQPIPAFSVIPIDVFRKNFLHAERGQAVAGQDGQLSFLADRTDIPQRLRVEALGYRTQDGPEFRLGDDASRTQDFRLQPSPPVTGTVLDANGQPVPKAVVLLATPTQAASLSSEWDNHKVVTDEAGRFAFPDPGEPWAVVVQADAGFALADLPADRHDAGTLRLRPWASVRGQLRDGGKTITGATMMLQPVRLDGLGPPRIEALLQTVTGADGRFEFSRVPPVPVSVGAYLGPWKDEGFRSGPHVPLDLQPGQRVELDLGGTGATVTGQVKLTGKVPADLDCTYSLNYLVRREPGIAPPPAIAGLGFDIRKGWRDTWLKSAEGQTYLSTLRTWFVKLAPDGAFRISGVPPGEYDLAVEIYAKPSGCLVDPLAQKVVRVTVTEADAARGELALPEIAATVVPIPAVGDTPALTFKRADGADGTLADYRGRYTLVQFWASWCGPCKQQLPALRRLQERYAARGLATLSLSLDDEPAAWQAALKRLDLPWPQGRLATAGESGVSSVPVYWLLDPAGKMVGKVNDPDEMAALLAERLK
jgi:RNA polymerase sigma factor (sigma-70 family)